MLAYNLETALLVCELFCFSHVLAAEQKAVQKKDNPANFGFGCSRQCICEVLGQVPCPGVVPLPKHMRGKYRHPVD